MQQKHILSYYISLQGKIVYQVQMSQEISESFAPLFNTPVRRRFNLKVKLRRFRYSIKNIVNKFCRIYKGKCWKSDFQS